MKTSSFFLLLILSAGLYLTTAGTTEVVLQNGLNEYEGCVDSRIYSEGATNNFGDLPTLDIQKKEQVS